MTILEISTNIIEAILFAAGNAVPTDLLRDKLNLTKAQMDSMVRQLEKKYSGNCGIRLLIFNHKIQLATNPDYKEQVAAVLNPIREKEFTRTILECAAIIAYKQPITRTELDSVRGVNSDYAITTLLGLEMIEPCGRKDAPGQLFTALQAEIAQRTSRLRRTDEEDCGNERRFGRRHVPLQQRRVHAGRGRRKPFRAAIRRRNGRKRSDGKSGRKCGKYRSRCKRYRRKRGRIRF